jgi:hypothetical protein
MRVFDSIDWRLVISIELGVLALVCVGVWIWTWRK